MKKVNLKDNIVKGYYKLKNKIWTIPTTLLVMSNKVFATDDGTVQGSISIAEVNQATQNIKDAVIKLAMPIRWDFSICKYSYYCIKNDS